MSQRVLPKILEPIRPYIESLKPWPEESLESVLGDETNIRINAPRALMALEFQSKVFGLAKALKDGQVYLYGRPSSLDEALNSGDGTYRP